MLALIEDPATVLDLTELPARLQAIAATLGAMLSQGYSKAEIARFYAKSRPWVSARLLELEDELRRRIERFAASNGLDSDATQRSPSESARS